MVDISPAEKIRKRQEILEEERAPWDDVYKLVGQYVCVIRELGFEKNVDEKKLQAMFIGKKIYDGAPVNYFDMLINGFQGHIVAPSIRWMLMQFVPKELQDNRIANIWLRDVQQHIYEVAERTNFYFAYHQHISDCAGFGVSCLYSENDPDESEPYFLTIHPSEFYFDENPRGKVDTCHRKFQLSAFRAVEMFGKENLSNPIQQDAEKVESMDRKHTFIHAVALNKERVYGKMDSSNKKWASVYVEANPDETLKTKLLRKKGYDTFPYQIWRWDRSSDSKFGISPVMKALVDIRKLNQVGKDLLDATHVLIRPAMQAPSKYRHDLNVGPGGIMFYENYQEEQIKPVHSGINYPFGIEREKDIREIVKTHLMADFFLLLAERQHNMTATEVLEIQGEKAAVLGTTVGLVEVESLDPSLRRMVMIEAREGRLPPPPEILRGYSMKDIRIDFIGPLAQIQKRAYRTKPIVQALQVAGPLVKLFPETMDIVNADVLVRELFEGHDIPAEALNSEDKVRKIRAARAEATRKQKEMEMMTQAAQAAPKLAKAPEEGSVLEQIQGQLPGPTGE